MPNLSAEGFIEKVVTSSLPLPQTTTKPPLNKITDIPLVSSTPAAQIIAEEGADISNWQNVTTLPQCAGAMIKNRFGKMCEQCAADAEISLITSGQYQHIRWEQYQIWRQDQLQHLIANLYKEKHRFTQYILNKAGEFFRFSYFKFRYSIKVLAHQYVKNHEYKEVNSRKAIVDGEQSSRNKLLTIEIRNRLLDSHRDRPLSTSPSSAICNSSSDHLSPLPMPKQDTDISQYNIDERACPFSEDYISISPELSKITFSL